MSGATPLTRLVGDLTAREWLTVRELQAYAKFPSANAVRKYLERHASELRIAHRGRRLLIDRLTFDRHVERCGRH